MAAQTTIIFPADWPNVTNNAYTRVRDQVPQAIPTPSNRTTVIDGGFQLYLPFSPPATGSDGTPYNTTVLLEALGQDYDPNPGGEAQIYIQGAGSTEPVPTDQPTQVLNGGALYIPVTNILPTEVSLEQLWENITSAGSDAIIVTTSGPVITTTGPASTTVAGASGLPTTSRNDAAGISQAQFDGALAGGIIGAFILGALLCFLAVICFARRRRSNQVKPTGSSRDSSHEEVPLAGAMPLAKYEKSSTVTATPMLMGWQKHLPQEKDDGTIGKTFNSIFEQARMHLEGYYQANPQGGTEESMKALQQLAGEDLPPALRHTNNGITLLDAVLVRWIVHRISGRSSVEDSLLPRDFAAFAKKNSWDMERDVNHIGNLQRTMTQKKRGYPQAFAQWRQLTGFLLPEHSRDPTFQQELKAKLDNGVQTLDTAFAPWESHGKNSKDRMHSLRQILLQASDAGILLFTQPSEHFFDWTPKGHKQAAAVVTPALLRKSDESGGSSSEVALVQPTLADV